MLSVLCETNVAQLSRSYYHPKYPGRTLLTVVGSGIGGGYLGGQAASAAGIDPMIGVAAGALNGLYLGNLASEYIDRKQRESEGTPYKGPRTIGDTAKETAIHIGIGTPAAAGIAGNFHSPALGVLGGNIVGNLGRVGFKKLFGKENSESKKKEKK